MRTFKWIGFIIPIVLAGCLPVNITNELRLQPDGSGTLVTDASADLQEWAELLRSMDPELQNVDEKRVLKLTADYLDQQVISLEQSTLGEFQKRFPYVRQRRYTVDNHRHWITEIDFQSRADAERKVRAILRTALPSSQATNPEEQELEQTWRELLTEPDPFFTRWQLQRKDNVVSFSVQLSPLTPGQFYRVVFPGQLVSATDGQVQRTPQGDAIIWEGDVLARDVSAVWRIASTATGTFSGVGTQNSSQSGSGASPKPLPKVQWRGKPYFVDVMISGRNASVWLRVSPHGCGKDDVKVMELKAQNLHFAEAAKLACRAKGVYDGGKAIVGCAATIGTGVCAVSAVPSGGATAAVCTSTLLYTMDKGLADCLMGVSDAIADSLGYEKEWAIVAAKAAIDSGQFAIAMDKMIDGICADIKKQ